MPLIYYLHGFNSSPRSHKAFLLRQHMAALNRAEQLQVPRLSPRPGEAIAQLAGMVEDVGPEEVCLVGSSLGGFYATWLAEHYAACAVLINPAVAPHRLLEDYLGPQRNPYTGEEYALDRRHLEELSALEVERPSHPERFLVLLQTGDEVLDYRDAAQKFAAADLRITEGGDHAFQGFDIILDEVLAFCDACAGKGASHAARG